MPLPEQIEEQVVVGMYDRGLLAFPEGGIELKSGRRAPYYYNVRHSLSFSRELERSGKMSIQRQREFRILLAGAYATKFSDIEQPIDHVFGKAQAVTAPAAVGAYEAGLSYLWERIPEPGKTYGHHQRIEGNYEAGEFILMGDDVVTDGKSKIEGSDTLSNVGLLPVAVTLQFDREEGGVQVLEGMEYEVNAITTLSRATGYLLSNGRINTEAVDALQAYHEGLRDAGHTSTFAFAG